MTASHPTPTFESVNVGDSLPELAIELTTSLIVGGALASRDYTPVHHDKSAAQAAGMGDVFMNILTTNGLVSRYVTDWAGTDARLTGVATKLGTPNMPGDTMKFSGSIEAKDEASGVVEISVNGKNAWGSHVTGVVKVALPQGA
jgi:acyl dehydratase